jgi:hypothetical protein
MTLRLSRAALFLALPILAVPAFAEPQEPAEDAPETEESAQKEEAEEAKICKRVATEMGSRRRTKLCKTREEWKAYNEANRGRRH